MADVSHVAINRGEAIEELFDRLSMRRVAAGLDVSGLEIIEAVGKELETVGPISN